MLPVKEIVFAREVNDIKYMHLNHYIFAICLLCRHGPFLWRDYTWSAVNKEEIYFVAFVAEKLSPFSLTPNLGPHLNINTIWWSSAFH